MRELIERLQLWIYLAAIGLGLGLGSAAPGLGAALGGLLWPALALLLYATFSQVPLGRLRGALRDGRFMAAVLIGNFLLVPLLVWGLLPLVPDDPALRLGVALVLLVPCTDWFITFAHLARGDAGRAVAVTPLNLVLQLVLLAPLLWLLLGSGAGVELPVARPLMALLGLVLLPLLLAWLTRRWAGGESGRRAFLDRLGVAPVPLLALVLLVIAASEALTVMASLAVLAQVLPAFIAYLVIAPLLALGLARLLDLPATQARTLAVSLATRNSFVVLPLALALPAELALAPLVIVLQSLVELFGMIVLVWWLPRWGGGHPA